jgi:nucleoside phosphorylase
MEYIEKQLEDLEEVLSKGIALVVTATDTETDAMHKKMQPLNNHDKLIKFYQGTNTYFGGVFGKYAVVHVQCGMGSVGRDSSITTISDAINHLTPKFVIMIGIAFGIDRQKQEIGDVLVSEGVIPYNNKRVGDKSTIHRGQSAPSSSILLNRFKSIMTWDYPLRGDIKANKIFTQILSGEELIDNKAHRDELLETFAYAKGGEMEGVGLYAACDRKADWILVKGICDFADGNKGENKNNNQNIAVNSALSLCLEVFNSDYAFKELEFVPIENKVLKISSIEADKILFEVYRKEYEKFYIKRLIDGEFYKNISHFSLWVYGTSGGGKTNLIFRNLIYNNVTFKEVGLAAYTNCSMLDLFKGIYYELSSKLDNKIEDINFPQLCKKILSLLESVCENFSTIILIDEIPICDEEEYSQFVNYFSSLLIQKNKEKKLDKVKFVLSSIANPTRHIKTHQSKIHEQLKFISLEDWEDDDIRKLIGLISKGLDIEIDSSLRDELVNTSKKSPRFVKKYFRNIIATNANTLSEYKNLLRETARELGFHNNE